MIQLHHQALFVIQKSGNTLPMEFNSLIDCLIQNCSPSIEIDRGIWEKVTDCIIRHYRDELHQQSVDLDDFIELAQTLMSSFALALNHQKQFHPGQLDLFETACCHGTGFELEFFLKIRSFLQNEVNLTKTQSADKKQMPHGHPLQITGLRRCAKYLSGRQRWSKRCVETRDEILNYVRQEATRLGAKNLLLTVLS